MTVKTLNQGTSTVLFAALDPSLRGMPFPVPRSAFIVGN